MATVEIVAYDARWPALFRAEEQRIVAALGSGAIVVQHVGSTAVPGLAAKPVIDIVLVVRDSADEPDYLPRLEGAGYTLRHREPAWFEHRMLNATHGRVNLHVFSQGCVEVERMVLFRDWLRRNADDRALYAKTKMELAGRQWPSVQDYADAKTAVVAEILARAFDARAKA